MDKLQMDILVYGEQGNFIVVFYFSICLLNLDSPSYLYNIGLDLASISIQQK